MKEPKFFRIKTLLLVFLVLFASAAAGSQAYGDGSDGSLTVTSDTVVNDYTYLTGDEALGSSSIAVNDASKFSSGDEVMIIQMQNGTGNGVAGRYEFREVKSISSGVLNLEKTLDNSYFSGSFSDGPGSTGEATQVIRIPEYENLSVDGGEIVPNQWNGRTGGVLAFRVQEKLRFANGGVLNATAKGFRGGTCGDCGDDWDGGRGEGITGWQKGGGVKDYSTAVESNNWNGGGGDHVNDNNGGDPGAGGGHATSGENSIGDGGDSEGGDTIGSANLQKMFFGGGGGAGSDNDNYQPHPEKSDGGGIVFVSAQNIENSNILTAGADGITGLGSNTYGGNSGGGAGGTVFLRAQNITINQIDATGGSRSSDAGDGEQGGAGGNGRVRLDYDSISGLSNVNPDPGYTGDAPDFCDERGPRNECYIKSKRDISSQSIEIVEPFAAFPDSEIFSSTFSPLTVQNSANISSIFRGSINFSAEDIRLKSGASFRPENGRILLDNQ